MNLYNEHPELHDETPNEADLWEAINQGNMGLAYKLMNELGASYLENQYGEE